MTKNLTSAEMDMFRIGARQAIMDKIDVTQINADLMKRLFGRNGDITKLKSVFPNEKSFETFSKGMEREAEFILTRRTATENYYNGSTGSRHWHIQTSIRLCCGDTRFPSSGKC